MLRPLSGIERFYWLLDMESSDNFVLVATTEGPVDPDQVARALEAARKRHPLLDARVSAAGNRLFFEQAPAGPFVPEVRQGGEDDWRACGTAELDRPFPPGSWPLVRVILFPAASPPPGAGDRDGVTRWVFSFNHTISDARCAAALVAEILGQVARTRDLPPLPLLPPQEHLYPVRYRGWRAHLLNLWLTFRDFWGFLATAARQIPGVDRSRFLPRTLRTWTFPWTESDTAALVARCRAEGTSVQGALVAAHLVATRAQFPEPGAVGLLVGSAVSSRSFLEPKVADENMGMYATFSPNGFKVAPGAPFWDLAREARRKNEERIAGGGPFVLWSTFPSWMFPPDQGGAKRILGTVLGAPPSTFVTNTGVVPDPGPTTTHVGLLMAPQPGSCLCTAAATFRGRLGLACTLNLAVMDEARAATLARDVDGALRAALSTPGTQEEHPR